jgi:hypothetical protein
MMRRAYYTGVPYGMIVFKRSAVSTREIFQPRAVF